MTAFASDPLPGQVVFQCASCRAVLGDSTDYCGVAGVGGASLIVLQAANEVTVDRIPQTEALPVGPDGADADTTFFAVCCSECGSAVGRMYTVVPPELAPVLHRFAYAGDRIASYALGSAALRSAAASAQPAAGAQPGNTEQQQQQEEMVLAEPEGEQEQQAEGGELGELRRRLEEMEADILQLKYMYTLHEQKIASLDGDAQ
eukprot:scaffold3.g6289.t1